MSDMFLSLSKDTWDIIFLVLRYGVAALFLAYLTSIFLKRKKNVVDIKGQIYESRIESYKEIHHHVMRLQSNIASPAQKEEYYQYFISLSKFKTGYQGLEYCSIFHSPERLMQYGIETNKLDDKSTIHIDYVLEQKLTEFEWWIDDVVDILVGFVNTEKDSRWRFNKSKIDDNIVLACQLLGIVLQDDVNNFYHQFDKLLRNRLQRIRLSSIGSDSIWIKAKHKLSDHCEAVFDKKGHGKAKFLHWIYNHILYRSYGCSKVRRNSDKVLTLLTLVHFSEEIEKQSFRKLSQSEFAKRMQEFQLCFKTNIDQIYQRQHD